MGEWQNGLCGCFNNFGLCIVTYFVPCYTFGKNAEAVGEGCCLYGIIYFVPFLNLFCLTQIRGKIREQKGIDGSCIGDLLMIWCCHFCSLVQEAQEIRGAAPIAQSMARE